MNIEAKPNLKEIQEFENNDRSAEEEFINLFRKRKRNLENGGVNNGEIFQSGNVRGHETSNIGVLPKSPNKFSISDSIDNLHMIKPFANKHPEVIDLTNDDLDIRIIPPKRHNFAAKTKNQFSVTRNEETNNFKKKIEYINLDNSDEEYTINSFSLDLLRNPSIPKKKKRAQTLFPEVEQIDLFDLDFIDHNSKIITDFDKESNSEIDSYSENEFLEIKPRMKKKISGNNNFKFLQPYTESFRAIARRSVNGIKYGDQNNQTMDLFLRNILSTSRIRRFLVHNREGNEVFHCDIEYQNDIDSAPIPNWKLVTKNVIFNENVKNFISLATAFTKCCDCEGKCSNIKSCFCSNFNYSINREFTYCYEIRGEKKQKSLIQMPKSNSHIFECSPRCPCIKSKCHLSLINMQSSINPTSMNLNFRLQRVLKSREVHGKMISKAMWGLYTKVPIAKNSFVIDYCGEVISNREAEKRGKIYDHENLSYLFDICEDVDEEFLQEYKAHCKKNKINYKCLENKTDLDEEDFPLVIDAMEYGNLARFINHSCKPNLKSVNVHIECKDPRFGVIALFSLTDIPANTELTMDYNYPNVEGAQDVYCLCNEKRCRGYLYRGVEKRNYKK